MLHASLRPLSILAVALALISLASGDLYDGFGVWTCAEVRENYLNVYSELSDPPTSATAVFRNLGYGFGNLSSSSMNLEWPHGYNNAMVRCHQIYDLFTYNLPRNSPRASLSALSSTPLSLSAIPAASTLA